MMKFQMMVVSLEARLFCSLTRNRGQGETDPFTNYTIRFSHLIQDNQRHQHTPGVVHKGCQTNKWITSSLHMHLVVDNEIFTLDVGSTESHIFQIQEITLYSLCF